MARLYDLIKTGAECIKLDKLLSGKQEEGLQHTAFRMESHVFEKTLFCNKPQN
jgi:hypothetical protein